MIVRMTGGLMLACVALYIAHFIFDILYGQPIWTVLNIVSGVGIVVALAVHSGVRGAPRRTEACRSA